MNLHWSFVLSAILPIMEDQWRLMEMHQNVVFDAAASKSSAILEKVVLRVVKL